MVNQIQKNAKDIDQRLSLIETANLFKSPILKHGELLSCKVSIDYLVRRSRSLTNVYWPYVFINECASII